MSADSEGSTSLQLKDANTWTSFPADMASVGTTATISDILQNLDDTAVKLTSSTAPSVVGYGDGLRWDSGDQDTTQWVPQGLAHSSVSINGTTHDYAIVSWHFNTDNYSYNDGSRISIIDTTSLASSTYRSVILVRPTGTGTYEPIKIHAGGIAIVGTLLYVADTSHGFLVFDLNNFRNVDGSSTLCRNSDGSGIFAEVGTEWCADGYGYMLPQVDAYEVPSTLSSGTAIAAYDIPKFSFAGIDTRTSTNQLLSGEYCNDGSEPCICKEGQSNCACPSSCDTLTNWADSTGLNGRLYQWPIGSDNRLVTSNLYVTPTKTYWMNERNV